MTTRSRFPTVLLIALLALLVTVSGCNRHPSGREQCLSCHGGIEQASPSHGGCVSCHGGNPGARGKGEAHRGIYGLSDRSYPGRWELGCGPCHPHQLERMRSSQMYTGAGMIARIQATWEGETPGLRYGSLDADLHDLRGEPFRQQGVAGLEHLSGELYRKFCARCHLARGNPVGDGSGHPAGCAACHFPYSGDAVYRGGDRTMAGKTPSGPTHLLQPLPPMQACSQCHHRSGRIALNYQGLYDGNGGLVPVSGGKPGPVAGSDGRTFTHITPDIHFSAGMECIDCHTSREVMGEGYASADMHGQLEVTCADCHGSYGAPPSFRAVMRENDPVLRESRAYRLPMGAGAEMMLTSRGRPFSNVFHVDGNVVVQTKRTGRFLRARVITGTPEHRIAGHDRLACTACHSRTVIQCYGCHTSYDRQERQFDFVRGQSTPGQFTETEDYRTLYPFPLAIDRNGRISPVTPGCQTFVTVVEKDGRTSRDESVALYGGKRQHRFAPFFGHNTGSRAVGCAECHANPAFLGFGQHIVSGRSITGTMVCPVSGERPLDGFLTMDGGEVLAFSAVGRGNARPLNQAEVRRALSVNLCLVCHNSAKDPIYRKRINYRDLDDALHRRLLAPR